MLKNIKLFSIDSDRTTYESSASYERPYVSKVAADNSVHYNKVVQVIEFIISDSGRITTLQAEEGMTWQDWVNSEYNIDGGYVVYNSEIWTSSFSGVINNVTPQDIIVAKKYTLSLAGGSSD